MARQKAIFLNLSVSTTNMLLTDAYVLIPKSGFCYFEETLHLLTISGE